MAEGAIESREAIVLVTAGGGGVCNAQRHPQSSRKFFFFSRSSKAATVMTAVAERYTIVFMCGFSPSCTCRRCSKVLKFDDVPPPPLPTLQLQSQVGSKVRVVVARMIDRHNTSDVNQCCVHHDANVYGRAITRLVCDLN